MLYELQKKQVKILCARQPKQWRQNISQSHFKDKYHKKYPTRVEYFYRGLEILWVFKKAYILVPQANELFI